MICQVAILAGGMGTRLRSKTGDLPKPMAPIMGKPVLEHQIMLCRDHGFTDIALLVHYQSDAIRNFFGDGAKWGVSLTYVVEKDARGTAGALRDALPYLADQFLVLYADTYADIDLGRFWLAASEKNADGMLFLHPNDHPQDSDLVEVDDSGAVVAIRPYPHPEGVDYPNLVNAALYALKKAGLDDVIPLEGKHDLAKHTFARMLQTGRKLHAYITPEYIKDMGTPARLEKVERDLIHGLPERLSTRHARVAVFLDRDGTINREVDHLKHLDQLEILPGACDAIHAFNRAGCLAVGVTNQPVLARGDIGWDDLRKIHARLDQLLGHGHAYLDRMYVCPHHPDKGFASEVPELKMQCDCRKPESGLIDGAVRELNISRRDSWMVGDTTGDILAGQRAGLRTVLVRTGYAGRDYKYDVEADFICDDLDAAAALILRGYPAAVNALLPIAHAQMSERVVLIGGASRSGKSTVARVLQELVGQAGKTAHVISLDAWLKSPELRHEGEGVLSRYDLENCGAQLTSLARSQYRETLKLCERDRKTSALRADRPISVGPQDMLIVEGVPALLAEELRSLSDVTIHVEAADEIRKARVAKEYQWRGHTDREIEEKIESRELDEVALVKNAADRALYRICF